MKDKQNMHWVFDDNADDVRGWPVHENDVLLGTVDELMVDPETSFVTAVQLSDGTRIGAERVQIGDNVLLVSKAIAGEPRAEVRSERKGSEQKKLEPKAEQKVEPKEPKVEPKEPKVEPRPVPAPEPKPQAAAPSSSIQSTKPPTDDITIDLASEEIEVGKRRFDAGGVHLEAHLVAESIGRDVTLKGEHVTVEREMQDRVLSAADAEKLFHDGAYEVKVRAEVPTVTKSTHVVEELVIKKADTERDEIIRETIRQMDAAITEIAADTSTRGKQGGVR